MHEALERLNAQRLRSYNEDPGLLREHYGIEQTVLAGGYGYRQVLELVQNGADAVLEGEELGIESTADNRIHVLLRDQHLYVANTGAPFSEQGLDSLLRSHASTKRGNQIGRFGLGFKSLLKLDGRIDVFTRASGAICFDPERCREELSQRYKVTEVPGLRLAWVLQADERVADPVCVELRWAETIVRVEVRSTSLMEHLREEIRSFPAEFLLFLPIATTLTLDDGEEEARHVRLGIEGAEHILHDGATVSRWRVATRGVRIQEEGAIADATHIHARVSEPVPVSWAVPIEGRREESGRFWAFFPTQSQSYLPGILNAPWKVNSDRNAIIGGEWNAALMFEAAQLIAETLPGLATTSDPGLPLDAFPRQPERRDVDAAPLIEALWSRLLSASAIPDCAGVLRDAQSLLRHPNDSEQLANAWQVLAGEHARRALVHPSCLRGQRASRLNMLATRSAAQQTEANSGGLRRLSAAPWFDHVTSLESSVAMRVLKLAEQASLAWNGNEWQRLRHQLAIIPTESGELVSAPRVVLAPDGVTVPGRATVAASVQADAESCRILKDVIHVSELDDQVWMAILEETLHGSAHSIEAQNTKWKALWSRLRSAPEAVRGRFLRTRGDHIHVRRQDGRWVLADQALLPGALVEASDISRNQKVLVDHEMHDKDWASLRALRVQELPQGIRGPTTYEAVCEGGTFLDTWLQECRRLYKSVHDNAASWAYLEPESLSMPRGYLLLTELSGPANARLTTHLLDQLSQTPLSSRIRFGHSTVSAYPRIDVPPPLPWFILRYGAIVIGSSAMVRLAAVRARAHSPVLRRLSGWSTIEPHLELLRTSFPDVPPSSADIQALWRAAIAELATGEAATSDTLTDLWAAAAKDGVVPSGFASPKGAISLSAVFVTTSAELAERARLQGHTVVTLDTETLQSWKQAGAQDLKTVINAEWASLDGERERLIDVLPELTKVLRDERRDVARCQRVTQLSLKIGETRQPTPCLMWDGALHVDIAQLAPLSRAVRLRELLGEIAPAGWLSLPPDEALQQLGDGDVDDHRSHVAAGNTLAERLLRAVGGRREPLLEVLGERLGMIDAVRVCPALQLAELVLSQLGPTALSALRSTFEEEGLKPPQRWSQGTARDFVTSLGFPVEFASSGESRREPEELVSGPINLPPLHDFQEEVLEGLSRLLGGNTTRRRAVVSLPTGAGKTRVTVEAAVRLVLAPEGPERFVLWIAQTDELCEQAVQAFRQVWLNRGAERMDLRIVRLWGGNGNPVEQETKKPLVVIASIQTLNSRFGLQELEWLRKPGMVVVDECHYAITPSYSRLLRWLDAESSLTHAPAKGEVPLLGLSATPFRADDEESQRLSRRFDSRWLPPNQEQLYERLHATGVLAHAHYDPLDSGVGLTEEELERLSGPWEGLNFENLVEEINQRLATDVARNDRLLEFIRSSTEQAILFFTNSVAHAEEMAARLSLTGIPAAAVSGSTLAVTRRYFLDCFQNGRLRVLCNHSVLSTGFDAPKTDMVLIARQVFSPVRYMQMVGRGLRGEKNGGTARCRIVTVVDNLGRFQERHPYKYCRDLYHSGS